ncbi:MAG: putative ABC transport system permease protein [Polaribacter sp.]|jgi:putative ABC transport system permease protein
MFKNYIKVAIRNLKKNKIYAAINILGLALGLMVSIIVFLYVNSETNYERHITDFQQIYRVGIKANMMGQSIDAPISCSPMAQTLRTEFADVVTATRMQPIRQEIMLKHEETKIYIPQGVQADSSFFTIFDFQFIHGDPHTALKEDNAIVITEATSQKIFGNENPMEKIIRYDDRRDCIVRGVIAEPEGNSHFSGNFYISENEVNQVWISNGYHTYLKLRKGVDQDQFKEVMSSQFLTYIAPNVEQFLKVTMEAFFANDNTFAYDLQPIQSIHLHSHRDWEIQQNGNIMYIYVFMAIAFLVLLIAGINFMNLSTARSSKRAKEVGVRKVSGATDEMLMGQFLMESVMQSFIALFLAFIMVELFLPAFNNVMESDLSLFNNHFVITLGFAFAITLLYGLFSGSYPAFFLSSFEPIAVLKGDMTKTKGGSFFRKSLVVVQFTASIILIIGMAIIFLQISFIHNKDLGFSGDQVLVVPIQTDKVAENFNNYKGEFLKNPNVMAVSRSSYLPGGIPNQNMFEMEGSQEHMPLWNMEVDYDFFETLNLELAEGKSFSKDIDADSTVSFILNETAIKSFNIENPIGKRFSRMIGNGQTQRGTVIGIVKDFHIEGFNQPIKPMILSAQNQLWWVSMKIGAEDMAATIDDIESKWNKIEPSHPFRYTFLDESFGALFKQQENFGKMFFFLTLLAILISCMGLYGLAAYTAEQRTKEIGIRTVLGATIPELMVMLTKDFVKLVLLANLFAWPITLILARNWLSGFSYQISIPFFPFILAALLAVVIALVTVSYQAYLVSNSDPVNALKYE